MKDIITDKTNKDSTPHKDCSVLEIETFGFKVINFECSCYIAKAFEEQNLKVSVPNIYDIPVLMNLIYRSFSKKALDLPDNGLTFKIKTADISENIYRGDRSSNGSRRKRLFSLLHSINELRIYNRNLLKFDFVNKSCYLTIYPAFLIFGEQHLKKANAGCIKILPKCNFELDRLRSNARGYALFIEKLYSFFIEKEEEKKGDFKTYLRSDLGKQCKTRLLKLFQKSKSKHHLSFAEIHNDGQDALNKQGITDEQIKELAETLKNQKNSSGVSPVEKLNYFEEIKSMITKMIDTKTDCEEIFNAIDGTDKTKLTENQISALKSYCSSYSQNNIRVA